jgi:hypothetical protein
MNPPRTYHRLLLLAVALLIPVAAQAQCATGNAKCIGTDCLTSGDVEYAEGNSKLVVSDGKYEFGSFKEDVWTAGYQNGQVRTNTTPSFVRVGPNSMKHSIWGPDTIDSNGKTETGKRAELSDLAIHKHPIKDSSGNYYYYWYGWSYYIPNDANWTTAVRPQVAGATAFRQFVGQWRFDNDGGCVTMNYCNNSSVGGSGHHIIYDNGNLILTLTITDTSCATQPRLKTLAYNLGAAAKGQWMDFVVQAKWTSASSGMMKVWLQKNGGGYTEVMNYTGPTWLANYNPSPCNYAGAEPLAPNWQLGMYWSDDAPLNTTPRVLYTDEANMNRTLCATGYGSEGWNITAPAAGTLNGGTGGGTATVTEMETRSYTTSSGDSMLVTNDSAASAAQHVVFVCNAVGDSTLSGITASTAGNYNVKLRARYTPGSGNADFYVNNVKYGSVYQYSTTTSFRDFDFGTIPLVAGANTFKWVIIGKDAASTGYKLSFDKLTLTPQ